MNVWSEVSMSFFMNTRLSSVNSTHYFKNLDSPATFHWTAVLLWVHWLSTNQRQEEKTPTHYPVDKLLVWLMQMTEFSNGLEKWKMCFLTLLVPRSGTHNRHTWTQRWRMDSGRRSPWRMFLCSSSSALGLWLSRLKMENSVDYPFQRWMEGWMESLSHTHELH